MNETKLKEAGYAPYLKKQVQKFNRIGPSARDHKLKLICAKLAIFAF